MAGDASIAAVPIDFRCTTSARGDDWVMIQTKI
jgi:hypothetical protein